MYGNSTQVLSRIYGYKLSLIQNLGGGENGRIDTIISLTSPIAPKVDTVMALIESEDLRLVNQLMNILYSYYSQKNPETFSPH